VHSSPVRIHTARALVIVNVLYD